MQNDWYQRDIKITIRVLIKQSTDTIHADIPKKYQKYILTTILKHENVLAKVNRSPWGHLHIMIPHDAYSIIIHVGKVTIMDINHE